MLQARTHWEKGGASRRPRGRICRMPEHAAVQERSCPPPWPQQDSTRAGGRVCWHMSKNHKQHIPTQHTQTIHMIKPKKQFITKNHKHGKSRPSGSGVLSALRVLCGRGVALYAVPRANSGDEGRAPVDTRFVACFQLSTIAFVLLYFYSPSISTTSNLQAFCLARYISGQQRSDRQARIYHICTRGGAAAPFFSRGSRSGF